jgi:hypothetical protein
MSLTDVFAKMGGLDDLKLDSTDPDALDADTMESD